MELNRGYGGYGGYQAGAQAGYNNNQFGGQYNQQGYQQPYNNVYKNPDVQQINPGNQQVHRIQGLGGDTSKMTYIFGGLCCCVFLPLIVVGFILVLSAIGKVENSFQDSFGGISASWKSDLIFGFTSNPSVVLPEGQYVSPWGGRWAGTVEGCNCPSSVMIFGRRNVWPGLKAHSCSFNETYSGCQRVTAQSEIQMNKWNGGEQIFAIKYSKTNFLENYQNMDTTGRCAPGYKLCGNPSSKSKGVCIKETFTECPITGLSDTAKAGADKPINLGSTTLYVGRDSTANPSSDVGVSEAFVCTARGLSSVTPGRKRYELLKGYTDGCVKDNEAAYFNEIGERNLFQVNQVPFTTLPEYDVDDKYKYKQWASRPLEWAPSCRDVIPSTQKLGQDIKVVSEQASSLKIFLIIGFIVALIAIAVQCCGTGIPSKIATGIALALIIVAICLIIPFITKTVSKANDFSNTFDVVSSRKCSTDSTNTQFDTMSATFKKDFTGDLKTGMWLLIAGCVLQALFSLYALLAKDDGDDRQPLMGPQGGSGW